MHRVGTDGVLLGAWASAINTKDILDIGTGTGVIALMLAQRTDAEITAIEPDREAFSIATENFESSTFHKRIQTFHTPLQSFNTGKKFDLIVCNPPFFENSLKPPTTNRQQQRHTDSLSQIELLEHARRLLAPKGKLAVVLPSAEGNRFMEHALMSNLFVDRACAVYSKVGKPQERWLLQFANVNVLEKKQTTLHIMDAQGQWMEEYKTLTRDFYLNL